MTFTSWLCRRFPFSISPRNLSAKPRATRRFDFDLLEDRVVPSHTVSVAVVSPPATFFEGVAINLSSTVIGAVGTPSYAWTVLKDGASFAAGSTTDFSFTPDDNASYAVSLTVTDSVDAATAGTTLAVINQAPVAGVSGPTVGVFGQSLTFNLTATDAAADAAAGFTYSIDWNSDGTGDETVPATPGNGAGVDVSHTFALPGPNTFTVTATDQDGAPSDPVSHTVTTINGAAVVDGTLYVAGTFGNDRILLVPKGKQSADNTTVKVFINGVNKGTFTGVNDVTIFALDGNDFVHLAGSIKVPATIFGGAGNDRIISGAGNDLIVGGDGKDTLLGHTGNDILIGGDNIDHLVGGPGDDLLIAGSTIYDDDADALANLLKAWNAAGSYDQHVAALLDPTAPVHLTLTGPNATVLDDGARDRLTGAAGQDWFWATVPNDKVTDQHKFEFLNETQGKPPKKSH